VVDAELEGGRERRHAVVRALRCSLLHGKANDEAGLAQVRGGVGDRKYKRGRDVLRIKSISNT
jgi:hypothetical protein